MREQLAHAMLLCFRRLPGARAGCITHTLPVRGCSSVLAKHIRNNPFNVLGVSRDATKDEIRERYLALAKQHHPDASSEGGLTFARISAAYHALIDPDSRAAAELELQDPRETALELAKLSIMQCHSGRTGHGLILMADHVITLLETHSSVSSSGDCGDGSGSSSDSILRDIAAAASLVLELSAARGEPHHRPATKIWAALCRKNLADSRACQAFFALALRGGHTADAMRTIRYAEQNELELSMLMRSTARQVRNFKDKQGKAPDRSRTT